ncbi:MAG: hypothetical protein DMG38_07475 [Acidobacteria bacterium]|nr:MAG: hypothetical protein DMG38_07475 [Acidobacteriota bacterium]
MLSASFVAPLSGSSHSPHQIVRLFRHSLFLSYESRKFTAFFPRLGDGLGCIATAATRTNGVPAFSVMFAIHPSKFE